MEAEKGEVKSSTEAWVQPLTSHSPWHHHLAFQCLLSYRSAGLVAFCKAAPGLTLRLKKQYGLEVRKWCEGQPECMWDAPLTLHTAIPLLGDIRTHSPPPNHHLCHSETVSPPSPLWITHRVQPDTNWLWEVITSKKFPSDQDFSE